MASQCPTPDRLAALLKDDLVQSERTSLEAHLEECLACREKLNALAGGAETWSNVASAQDVHEVEALLARLKPEEGGERIGPYKLLQQIGEGGFGTVWMAEQCEPVKRRVALKIIKLGMDTKEVIARFEQERQALAMMDHPNIAKVFDAGATQWGRPFFVMELVRGVPITAYCDEQKLPVPERLALFIQVCQALQHAHQKGIIHRDLKPSNILVTAGDDHEPVPKVIDFGLAKAMDHTLTDKTLFTQFEQLIGTPAYMSPEQAGVGPMDIDTRSDIYSLGVLLYEMLTGKPPFDPNELRKAGHDEMRRVIREEEPPRPSTRLSTLKEMDLSAVATRRHVDAAKLASIVRGDLDWIVMKALEKNRNRRYETANGLAMEIRRHLAHEPVLARPPSFGYKAGKFLRKYKRPVTATAAVLLALIGGLAASTVLYLRQKAAWASEAEQRVAAERHAKAETAARQEAEAVSVFLRKAFPGPELELRDSTMLSGDLLGNAAIKLDKDLADLPGRRAKLQEMLAAIYYTVGRYQDAIPLEEQVTDYYVASFGPEHRETLRMLSALAILYARAGRSDAAMKLWDKVIGLRKDLVARSLQLNGRQHPQTWAVMNDLARSYRHADKLDEALKIQEEIVTIHRNVLGLAHPETLQAMRSAAVFYDDTGRRDKAFEMRKEIVTLYCEAKNVDMAVATANEFANSYVAADRADEALKMREEELALLRTIPGWEKRAAFITMERLANSYRAANRRNEALKLKEEALTLRRIAQGPEHPQTLSAMESLAASYVQSGRQNEALKLRQEVLALRGKVQGPEHADTLSAMHNLTDSYGRLDRAEEALTLQEEELRLRRKVQGSERRETLAAMQSLLFFYADSGRHGEALKLGEEILAHFRKIHGPENLVTLAAMRSVAFSYNKLGRQNEALKLQEERLALHRKVDGAKHRETLALMQDVANSYSAAGLWDKALPLLAELSSARSNDTFLAQKVTTLQAWFDKDSEHAATCRRIIALAAETDDPSFADRAAKAYCLRPSSDAQLLEAALALARRAVDVGKDHRYLPYYQMSLGMAEFRKGNYAAADQALVAAGQAENAHRHVREAVRFFHAMSLFRQGKVSEARKLFADAKAQMKPLPADERQPLANGAVADDIVIWLAYKEAKALLAEK